MAVSCGNVDVIIDHNLKPIPVCRHGPALLFSRFDKKYGGERSFFACSAFRDRKACPFFRWSDDIKSSDKEKAAHFVEAKGLWPSYSHKTMRERFSEFKNLKESQRCMCIDCGLLLLPEEQEVHKGQGHSLKSNLSEAILAKPTQLFKPLENNKTFAQYLFSSTTIDFVLDTLTSIDVTHVLCIGCPRIHEAVQERLEAGSPPKLESLLLDLDHRYGSSDYETYQDFIWEKDGRKVVMVIDPPFGVMVDALMATLNKIQDEWRKTKGQSDTQNMPVFWFFPYFMEQRVVTQSSGYTMLDYKVDYDNHDLFRGEKGRKKGSPVRIFTNLSADQVVLPSSDGYWYCEHCERYCAKENKHCAKCNTCPTKDGNTYIHCDKCVRCVKPSRVHCDTCNICDLPQHVCGQSVSKGCHICGEMDHKRRECPKRQTQTENSSSRPCKRKGGNQQSKRKKKKRK